VNLLGLAKTPAAESQTGAGSSDTWVEVVKELEVPMGGVAYLPDTDIDKVLDMSSETVRKVSKISIDTDQTMLLDLRNDKPLGEGKSADATELLFMEKYGRVFNASRAADKPVYKDYFDRTKPPADATNETPAPIQQRLRNGRPGPYQ